jgi:hypothetical protein
MEDHLLVRCSAAPPVLDRPADAGPTGCAEVTLPGEAFGEPLVLASGASESAQGRELAAEVLLEPGANLLPELSIGYRGSRPQSETLCKRTVQKTLFKSEARE